MAKYSRKNEPKKAHINKDKSIDRQEDVPKKEVIKGGNYIGGKS